MAGRFGLVVVLVMVAVSAFGLEDTCSAQYSAEQCEQMEGGTGNTGGGNTGGGSSPGCPYYMCGNAGFDAQSAWAWCEATQSWSNCPIYFCRYMNCVGTNCSPTWEVCENCSSRQGNTVRVSSCPRT